MTSLSAHLTSEIEAYADRLRKHHPLLGLAERGELDPRGVAAYLMNARYMVRFTPVHLEAARSRAEELNQLELAAFFARKSREEVGHDAWADQDLRALESLFGVGAPANPSRHLRDLVFALDRAISEEPCKYLSYILFAEYLMLLLGPIWLRALSGQCNIPLSALTIVTKHVELDQTHVADELRVYDSLLAMANAESYLDTLYHAMRLFELYCTELYESYKPDANADPVAAE